MSPPGHSRRRLVVDAALEAGRAPVDELDAALRLDHRDGRVHVLRHDVAAVHPSASPIDPEGLIYPILRTLAV